MPHSTLFRFRDRTNQPQVPAILRRLPPVQGAPITIESGRGLSTSRHALHAGSFLRERRIVFDCTRSEFPRIFVHELFHFAWLRLGNGARLDWEQLLMREFRAVVDGELGWSAEWRKLVLDPRDRRVRNRRWREYCCEAFCDTGAWLYSGADSHPEFTLPARYRAVRRRWFRETFANSHLPL